MQGHDPSTTETFSGKEAIVGDRLEADQSFTPSLKQLGGSTHSSRSRASR
jgi:hypothetical protein